MITGQQALWQVEQATAAARAEEDRCKAELAAAEAEIARLAEARSGLMRELAGARLEALRREGVAFDYASAEARALKLLSERKAALDDLRRRIAAAEAARAKAEAGRRAKAEEAGRSLAALEERQAGVEAQVRASGPWIAARERLEEAQRTLEAAERKAAAAEADRAAKGRPYEDDPLFMYLHRRGFGTPDYRAGFLARYFDGKIARLVNYGVAGANYRMLNEIPARLREHAARRKALVAQAREGIEAVEKAGLDAAGLAPLIGEARRAREELVATDRELSEADAVLKKLDAEQDRALAARAQADEAEAVRLVAESDARASIAELYRKAALTLSPDDDALVRRIEAGDKTLASVERARVELIGRARALGRRRHEIEAERARFHRRGYDNPMGRFSNEGAIADALGGFLKGAVAGAVLGQVFQQGYQERDRRADSSFGGGGGFNFPGAGERWPDPGGFDGWPDSGGGGFGGGQGGGLGGGPGGSGGGPGGDGFRTGGGF